MPDFTCMEYDAAAKFMFIVVMEELAAANSFHLLIGCLIH